MKVFLGEQLYQAMLRLLVHFLMWTQPRQRLKLHLNSLSPTDIDYLKLASSLAKICLVWSEIISTYQWKRDPLSKAYLEFNTSGTCIGSQLSFPFISSILKPDFNLKIKLNRNHFIFHMILINHLTLGQRWICNISILKVTSWVHPIFQLIFGEI